MMKPWVMTDMTPTKLRSRLVVWAERLRVSLATRTKLTWKMVNPRLYQRLTRRRVPTVGSLSVASRFLRLNFVAGLDLACWRSSSESDSGIQKRMAMRLRKERAVAMRPGSM